MAATVVVLISLIGVTGCNRSKDTGGTPVLDVGTQEGGTCLLVDEFLPAEVEKLPVVPCTEPHTHEVFAVVPFTESDVYPGGDALDAFAQTACLGPFEDFVGISAFDSSLTFSWLYPSLTGWNSPQKDRDVLCVLADGQGAKLTGSMQGSRI